MADKKRLKAELAQCLERITNEIKVLHKKELSKNAALGYPDHDVPMDGAPDLQLNEKIKLCKVCKKAEKLCKCSPKMKKAEITLPGLKKAIVIHNPGDLNKAAITPYSSSDVNSFYGDMASEFDPGTMKISAGRMSNTPADKKVPVGAIKALRPLPGQKPEKAKLPPVTDPHLGELKNFQSAKTTAAPAHALSRPQDPRNSAMVSGTITAKSELTKAAGTIPPPHPMAPKTNEFDSFKQDLAPHFDAGTMPKGSNSAKLMAVPGSKTASAAGAAPAMPGFKQGKLPSLPGQKKSAAPPPLPTMKNEELEKGLGAKIGAGLIAANVALGGAIVHKQHTKAKAAVQAPAEPEGEAHVTPDSTEPKLPNFNESLKARTRKLDQILKLK